MHTMPRFVTDEDAQRDPDEVLAPITATLIADLELSATFVEPLNLHRYRDVRLLCRLHGQPLGFVDAMVTTGRIDSRRVVRDFVDAHGSRIMPLLAAHAIRNRVIPTEPQVASLLTAKSPPLSGHTPRVTVAVCTRDRTEDLHRCLDALTHLDYPNLDLLVVDNAPATAQTELLVRRRYPQVRYVREPRPGLNWARNRAVVECTGEILAYTDDDVLVDRGWVRGLVDGFSLADHVMAVTGLVIPDELNTDAQRLFEIYGGFGRGFERRWYRAPAGEPLAPRHGGTGKFGTGANMAFRRSLFDHLGGFDPALDVGTCTNGGGDLEMFFRVLKAGHTLVYEPAAVVRHRHRRTYAQLRTQIANNGVGFYSYLTRTATAYADERRAVIQLGAWWLRWWNLRRLARAMRGAEAVPIDLIAAELVGSIQGLTRYRRAVRRADAIRAAAPGEPIVAVHNPVEHAARPRLREAVRHVDLSQPLPTFTDVSAYQRLRVIVDWGIWPVGPVTIEHHGATVTPAWIMDAVTQQRAREILDLPVSLGLNIQWAVTTAALSSALLVRLPSARTAAPGSPTTLPSDIAVSIVVATCDRPADLARCLASLTTQNTSRPVEIIVVDNRPESGLTSPVAASFPQARLIEERRAGLSYARNRGIAAASGSIIICTDDDVQAPPDWVERLLPPFSDPNVMVVTGNVVPLTLDNDAQHLFEAYGGLGRGFLPQRVDGEWFRRWRRAPPTWELGCTANAAFRRDIFTHPDIGLMDEALGAGTPTGCSEDTYLFYRVLRAGFTIEYRPEACVRHNHRVTLRALRQQIYAYAKGHVAYQLTTWHRDGDVRGLLRIGYELPRIYLRRSWERVRGRSDYPLRFIGLELLGTLVGPWALWRSRRRVTRLGRSEAPVSRAVRSTKQAA